MNEHPLLSLLARPVAYHRVFAKIGGGVGPGVMLSQAFYWSQRTSDPDGWFYKSAKEWEEETGMTTQEQRTARKKLQKNTWWQEEKKKAQGAPTIHFRIDLDALWSEILKSTNKSICGDQQMDLLGSTNGIVGVNKSDLLGSTNPINIDYSETTTKNTTDGGSEYAPGLADPRHRPKRASFHEDLKPELERLGISQKQFVATVDKLLERTNLKALADSNTPDADRTLSDAQRTTLGLLIFGITNKHDVNDLLDAWFQHDFRGKQGTPPRLNGRTLIEFAADYAAGAYQNGAKNGHTNGPGLDGTSYTELARRKQTELAGEVSELRIDDIEW